MKIHAERKHGDLDDLVDVCEMFCGEECLEIEGPAGPYLLPKGFDFYPVEMPDRVERCTCLACKEAAGLVANRRESKCSVLA